MITRYAYIDLDTHELLWGPGPMPYFITLKDGTAWEITAHTLEESEAVGIFVVEQVNYREFDDRFEQANLPIFEIVDGRPREVWSYHFIPSARINMAEAVDEHAESMRQIMATKYPGQYEEYNQAYAEAQAILSIPVEEDILPGTYQYVEADVGVSFSTSLQRVVETIREAAQLIIETRAAWKQFGANLRKARLLAKRQIKDAATDEAAMQIYNEFIQTRYNEYIHL